jgi:hypothetical protein
MRAEAQFPIPTMAIFIGFDIIVKKHFKLIDDLSIYYFTRVK